MRRLAVLDEDQPFWANADSFQAARLRLIGRRVSRFGPIIHEHLPDFDRRYAALQERVAAPDSWRDIVIPGDVLGGSILVDEQNQPLRVTTRWLSSGASGRCGASWLLMLVPHGGQSALVAPTDQLVIGTKAI